MAEDVICVGRSHLLETDPVFVAPRLEHGAICFDLVGLGGVTFYFEGITRVGQSHVAIIACQFVFEIEDMFGEEGLRALNYLVKVKLVEVQWLTTDKGVIRQYRTYYDTFQISMSVPILEASEIIRVVTMSEDEFREIEERIIELVKSGTKFLGDIVEKMGMSQIMVRALIKRSDKLEIRGMVVEVI